MELKSQQDIEAPEAFVFEACSDFAAFERQALRNGVEVVRTTGAAPVGVGTAWTLKLNFRERTWNVDAKIVEFESPSHFVIHGKTDGLDISLTVDLMALSRNATRQNLIIGLVPRGLKARLLIQSLGLVRGKIDAKINGRVAAFANDVERRYRSNA